MKHCNRAPLIQTTVQPLSTKFFLKGGTVICLDLLPVMQLYQKYISIFVVELSKKHDLNMKIALYIKVSPFEALISFKEKKNITRFLLK